jgi:ADAMTS-like protein 1/3
MLILLTFTKLLHFLSSTPFCILFSIINHHIPSIISYQQLRTVHCMVRVKNTTKIVDNILCEDAGLKEPNSIEKCGNIECPRWSSSEWSACQKSKCFAWHTALQKRNVKCIFGNDTVTDKCDENEKPTTKQECYNELCKGVWRVEQWSEVSF